MFYDASDVLHQTKIDLNLEIFLMFQVEDFRTQLKARTAEIIKDKSS